MAKRTLKNKTKNKTRSKSKRSRRQRGGAKITVNYKSDGMLRSVVLDIADTSTFRELEAKLKEYIKPNLFRRFHHVPNMNSPIVQTAFTAEVFAKTMPAILAGNLLKEEDIISIRKEKPVASLNSGHDREFNSNWPVYDEAEQKFVLDKLTARLGYEIAIRHQGGSGYIFYSVPHLTALCALFDDKTIDQCFETYFPPRPAAPSEAFDFIYLAFGDIFKPEGHMDKKTEADLTPAGRTKLEEYKSYPDEMFAAAAAAPAAGGAAAANQ
jgi:hypothetical protein